MAIRIAVFYHESEETTSCTIKVDLFTLGMPGIVDWFEAPLMMQGSIRLWEWKRRLPVEVAV